MFIKIIGEGPGEQEDLERKPFVGRSGQLLDRILASVDLDPETDVYITNTVKRRPKENRDPTPAEVRWYLPFVEDEVAIVDPWIILLVGRIAAGGVLQDSKIRITKVDMESSDWHYNVSWSSPQCLMKRSMCLCM